MDENTHTVTKKKNFKRDEQNLQSSDVKVSRTHIGTIIDLYINCTTYYLLQTISVIASSQKLI